MRRNEMLAIANAGKVTGIILPLQVILNHFSTRSQFESMFICVMNQQYCQGKEFSEIDRMKEPLNSQDQYRIKIPNLGRGTEYRSGECTPAHLTVLLNQMGDHFN